MKDTDRNVQEKYWYFPDNDGVVKKILSVFSGEDITIEPALQEFHVLERELVSVRYPFTVIKFNEF